MKYCNGAYDVSKEYIHNVFLKKDNNLCSSGIYYADGSKKITETAATATATTVNNLNKMKGGGSGSSNLDYTKILNKSPVYSFDLSNTIGGRPELIKNDNDFVIHNYKMNSRNNTNNNYDYSCKQPKWGKICE